MQKQAPQTIAIDISKDTLEVLSEKRSFSVANAKEGFAELVKNVRSFESPVAVFEATGGYERQLIEALASKAAPFARLNPARVRNFTRSEGVKAKTGPIDARMILRIAQQKDIRLDSPADPTRQENSGPARQEKPTQGSFDPGEEPSAKQPQGIHRSVKRIIKVLEKELHAIENGYESSSNPTPSFTSNQKSRSR